MKSNTDTQFWRDLKNSRQRLTKQQYRTLKGCGLPVATSRKARSTDRADRRERLAGKLVYRASGGTCPRRCLRPPLFQMKLCRPAHSAGTVAIPGAAGHKKAV